MYNYLFIVIFLAMKFYQQLKYGMTKIIVDSVFIFLRN